MIEMVEKGIEVGEVDDILFKTKNSKQKQGHFGLMTDNAINRVNAYRDGVISALSHFVHPKLY